MKTFSVDLFATPVSATKVKNGIFALKYPNGCININGEKYFGYSVKQAIKIWRSNKQSINKTL